MWGHSKKVTTARQEESSHQKPNSAGSWPGASSLENCEKIDFYCLNHTSYSPADTRWSLRCISWDKEFIPYALNLNIIQFILTGLYKTEQAAKDTMYISGLIPMGALGVKVESCLPTVFLPGFPGRLTSPFQRSSCWTAISETTESSPQQKNICIFST